MLNSAARHFLQFAAWVSKRIMFYILSLGIEDFTELAPESFNHKTHEMGVRHAAASG
jgi:hypothetical protein